VMRSSTSATWWMADGDRNAELSNANASLEDRRVTGGPPCSSPRRRAASTQILQSTNNHKPYFISETIFSWQLSAALVTAPPGGWRYTSCAAGTSCACCTACTGCTACASCAACISRAECTGCTHKRADVRIKWPTRTWWNAKASLSVREWSLHSVYKRVQSGPSAYKVAQACIACTSVYKVQRV
jgi:hypothetical protein